MTDGVGSAREKAPGDRHLFPTHLREDYLSRAQMITIRKRQIVVAEGSHARDVYLIHSGRLQASLVSSAGREVILREMGPDQIFGDLAAIDHKPRSASVVAIEDCRLAHLSGDAFIAFLGEVPQAGLWMVHQLAALVRDLTERTLSLATLPVASRVQLELLRLAGDYGDQAGENDIRVIRPLPTHAELAARIGTHREAVSRELNALANEGLVKQVGRTMTILSHTRLVALSDRARRIWQ